MFTENFIQGLQNGLIGEQSGGMLKTAGKRGRNTFHDFCPICGYELQSVDFKIGMTRCSKGHKFKSSDVRFPKDGKIGKALLRHDFDNANKDYRERFELLTWNRARELEDDLRRRLEDTRKKREWSQATPEKKEWARGFSEAGRRNYEAIFGKKGKK